MLVSNIFFTIICGYINFEDVQEENGKLVQYWKFLPLLMEEYLSLSHDEIIRSLNRHSVAI